MDSVMYRNYCYRLYPTRRQTTAMLRMLDTHRQLYNRALAERRDAWAQERRSVSYYEQTAQLTEDRKTCPDLALTNAASCQMTLRRLDRTFQAFFRRVKAGETPGYPRFKGQGRFNTVVFRASANKGALNGNRVYFQHIGWVRIVLHRSIAGRSKTLSFTRRGAHWYLNVMCDVGAAPPWKADHRSSVGIDVGLVHFATLSTGEHIANPRFFRTVERRVARAQQRLHQATMGTHTYHIRKRLLHRMHTRVANRRRDFAHKLSRQLSTSFGLIVFEDLQITHMVKNHCLAKSIADAAWNQLVRYTIYKAEEAGSVCLHVDPRGTSQRCCMCGTVVRKQLSERMHWCPTCGLQIDRDLNAARNILAVGLHSLGHSPATPLP